MTRRMAPPTYAVAMRHGAAKAQTVRMPWDKQVSLRRLPPVRASIRALSRPGVRWLGAAVASAAETAVFRRPTVVRPLPDGLFAHRSSAGTIVSDELVSAVTPERLRARTLDICCYEYTPRPGDTVLDIGAGAGEETVTFSRLVGPTGRVISVEAHPKTYRKLVLTCSRNRLTNVTPLNVAVGDARGTLVIHDGAAELGGPDAARIGGDGGTEVEALTIDDIVASQHCERVDLLKMNIEGAEQLAIRGMAKTLGIVEHVVVSCHDFVLALQSTPHDESWYATYDTVSTFFRDAGFNVSRRADHPSPPVPYYLYGSPR